MKVLLVQPSPPSEARVSALTARGHSVTVLTSNLGAARTTARVALTRPDRAVVTYGATPFPALKLLGARRIPVVLEVDTRIDDARGLAKEAARQALASAARSASALVVRSEAMAAHLEREVGIRGAQVLTTGPDISSLAPIPREAAKQRLDLPRDRRYLALCAPLGPTVRVDLLAHAHRRVPGVGLLVLGAGPGLSTINAMTVATRPSSPVIRLPEQPAALVAAICAAEVTLALREDALGEESLLYAGLGRRQVGLPTVDPSAVEAFFPEERAWIAAAASSDSALLRAIEEALDAEERRPPLSITGAEALRMSTAGGPEHKLVEVLEACA